MNKARNGIGAGFALAALLMMPVTAHAQGFSGGYNFLKAVKDRDGAKVQELTDKPGTTVVDSRDPATGENALQIVIKRRDQEWLAFLLGKGARPEVKDNDGNTALMTAATSGNVEAADLLIKIGARIDAQNGRGETPLIRAVQNRDVGMVRLLLQSGASAKIADNVTGMNAHDYAARDNRAGPIVKMLEETTVKPKSMMGPSL